jgi:hypothetical protein
MAIDMRCCGEHYPGQADEPLIAACQLCPASPTYWRRPAPDQEGLGAVVTSARWPPPGTGSAEVPTAARAGDAQRRQAAGDEVRGTVGTFHDAVDEQGV